jgi:hypothetical protein
MKAQIVYRHPDARATTPAFPAQQLPATLRQPADELYYYAHAVQLPDRALFSVWIAAGRMGCGWWRG